MRMHIKTKLSLLLLCILIILATNFIDVRAQTINSLFNLQTSVDLSVSPQNPQPGDTVTASLQAPGTNIDSVTISWYVNGAQKASAVGLKTFTTTAPNLGSSLTIEARLTTPAGDFVDRSATISSQDVDIIWESDSYTPPFYKGKALYSTEGNVVFTAMPNIISKSGVRVSPSNLIYKWSIDNSVLGDKSGYGKNALFYSGSILGQSIQVQVDVTAPDGTTGTGFIELAPQAPSTVLYENNPLYGVMFNNALSNGYKLKDSEIRVDAYPYFYSAAGKAASNLIYDWSLNGTPIPPPSQKNSAVFRNANNLSGTSQISVTTENSTRIFQQSDTNVNLNF